ncbi:MAG: type II toxin-antitoxin system HicB family antitoxin [Anaerolineae bacterium]|nr:type II toxin-antitoxin system HicB family antitoxin [Anaerolineae bacterium]
MSTLFALPIRIERTETGGYLATSDALPGFLVEGETMEDVYGQAPVVARELLEAYRQLDMPLPARLQPVSEEFSLYVLVAA